MRLKSGATKIAVAIGVVAAVALAVWQAPGQAQPVQAAALAASMNNNFFSPDPITVTVGDTITWSNSSGQSHTTTDGVRTNLGAAGGIWDQTVSSGSSSTAVTFNTMGTFQYFCRFHSGMDGSVVVQAAEATPTPAPAPTATPEATATPVPTATATPTPFPGGDLVIALHELNNSGQTGIAVLTAMGNETEVVLLATAGISELNHIHSGSCAALGGVAYSLTNMADGASMTMVSASLASLRSGGFAVNLHKTGDPATYTSCGDIPTEADALTVALNELGGSGQSGVATLISQGASTEVVLYATAGISELNHIHSGSCSALGGVSYPLTNMADGTSVTTVDVTLASLQSGDFAINLHKLGDPGTYTSCGDIPAGATPTPTPIPGVSAAGILVLAGMPGFLLTWRLRRGLADGGRPR